MNNKKGFILAYSVTLMTLVAVLIGIIVSMIGGISSGTNRIRTDFEARVSVEQIGEYFICSKDDERINETAKNAGLIVHISESDGKNVLEVYRNNRRVLLVETDDTDGHVEAWIYEGGTV